MKDRFRLMSYLLFNKQVLQLENYYKELKIISCPETDKKRINQLKFVDEVLKDLEERFNLSSKLIFDQKKMDELKNMVGMYGDLEKLQELSTVNKNKK